MRAVHPSAFGSQQQSPTGTIRTGLGPDEVKLVGSPHPHPGKHSSRNQTQPSLPLTQMHDCLPYEENSSVCSKALKWRSV